MSCVSQDRSTEGDLQEHFCRQEVTRACQGSCCFSPGKTEGHLCPAAGTQRHLPLTTSCRGLIPMADQPWLYKTQVLKILFKTKKYCSCLDSKETFIHLFIQPTPTQSPQSQLKPEPGVFYFPFLSLGVSYTITVTIQVIDKENKPLLTFPKSCISQIRTKYFLIITKNCHSN